MEPKHLYQDSDAWLFTGKQPKIIIVPFKDDADLIIVHLTKILGPMIKTLDKEGERTILVTFDCLYDLIALKNSLCEALDLIDNSISSPITFKILNNLTAKGDILHYEWKTNNI